jgi:hypothetical protein
LNGAAGDTEGLTTPHFTPKRYWKTYPVTKVGTETTTRVSRSTEVSTGLPRRSPVITPRVMPMTISKRIATMVSRRVMGKDSAISSVTLWPLKAEPKFPVKICPM